MPGPMATRVLAQGATLAAGWLSFTLLGEQSPALAALTAGGWLLAGAGLLVSLVRESLTHASREASRFRARAREEATTLERAIAARDAMIASLAGLADYRDSDTGAHLDRVATVATLIAHTLRQSAHEAATIDEAWIGTLRLASRLHDVGKAGVPDRVLLKAGRLDPAERSVMERHTLIGADALMSTRANATPVDPLIEMAIQVALTHHERWDGAGYPLGLKGDEIPLAGRIVAIADAYDAMTSSRVYRSSVSHQRAAEMIRSGAGTQFDPACVQAFLACEGEIARVMEEARGEGHLAAEEHAAKPAEAAARRTLTIESAREHLRRDLGTPPARKAA
ncbi:MAG: HD domain-containing phosphohydrolase [Planctomycetota bacterium]|nr:HD domain-containing phosphohydrolase [Planctomycetota bacterium]